MQVQTRLNPVESIDQVDIDPPQYQSFYCPNCKKKWRYNPDCKRNRIKSGAALMANLFIWPGIVQPENPLPPQKGASCTVCGFRL